MNTAPIYSVTQVNQYIKGLLDRDGALAGLFVRGELSNYKCYPSGHHYFSLKDAEGAIRCVMFRREAASLRFRPENGMKVVAFGRVTVFPRDGQYQLYCSQLTPDGVGELHIAFEQLKEKLYREGLFDPAHKKPIPKFPRKIALITSAAGAAVRDMLRILGARWPLAEVSVLPVRVQGAEAPGELCAAIAWANRHHVADLLITGRGGGSMEDLWAFNDEGVARAIYDCETPVISAVGHEPDVTIADFVADARASTPSNAAEIAVPDRAELLRWLRGASDRMVQSQTGRLEDARQHLADLASKRVMTDGLAYVQDKRMDLIHLQQRLGDVTGGLLGRHRQQFAALAASLNALSPLAVLGRGYAVARDEAGTILKSWRETGPGDRVTVTLGEGGFTAVVDRPYAKEKPRKKEERP